eukprot:gene20952-27155_t
MTTIPIGENGPTTRERLSTIVSGFEEFELDMKKGTRQRREKDEFRISELKNEMSRLDKDLIAEIKRRTEMNKSTQMWFEENLDLLNKTFHSTLNERSTKTNARIDEVNDRITTLDLRLTKEKEEIIKQIDAQGETLRKLLNEFKGEFEKDKILRLEREEKITEQLNDHEQLVDDNFKAQIEDREKRYALVRNMLEDNIKLREKSEEKFQTFFENQIHILHNQIKNESQIRQREDDEIIEALNRYTLKLQNSLKVVNSTDM